ncbi:MAG: iron transporter substrate-binding protein [Hyphomicrobiales bacterium]|nr:iron transporter substrate-binding protein [Hyphomicrobiales bacterium]
MKFFLQLIGAAAALIVSSSIVTAQDASGILVYNAQHVSLTQQWAAQFTKETGIKVTLRNGGDTELGNQIVQEGANSPADVFLTENSPAIALVDTAGLLALLDSATLALVPDNYRPASGRWTGIAARSTVFAYNTSVLKQGDLPKSLLDLADPKWKGRWAASPTGADFQAIVSALLELKGEDATSKWLKAMKDNVKPFQGNNAAMKGVNTGQVEGAVIYHYYYFGDQAKTGENSKNVALHYFKNRDPGAFISVSGGAVLASSKKKDQAQSFVRWIVGKGGQGVLRTGDSFEYAVGKDEASNPKLPSLVDLQAPTVEPAALNSKKVTELMTAAGLL